jgi:crotonobetaine/carnitine-CoA ligase
MDFCTWFEQKAGLQPDAPYILFEDQCFSYGQTEVQTNRAANLFRRLGLGKDDKCALVMNNAPEFLFTFFGMAKLGGVTACVNRHLRGEGLRYLIDQSDAKAAVLDADLAEYFSGIEAELPKLERVLWYPHVPEGRKGDLSLVDALAASDSSPPPKADIPGGAPMGLLHTGGTTGLPKWCILSHAYYMEIGQRMADFMALTRRDVLYNPLNLFHVNPQGYFVMGGIAAGAAIAFPRRFSASRFWRQVEQHRPTCCILHKGVVDILKQRPDEEGPKQHRVRVGYRLDAEFMERFNIPMSVNGYGSTEAGGLTNLNRYRLPLTAEEKAQAHLSSNTGLPRDDMEIRIGDDQDRVMPPNETGEILVRPKVPHVIFDGYYNQPQMTAEAFKGLWFHTGDMGFIDQDGKLNFVQRKAESIQVRGEWIFVDEVESVIRSHEAVRECAVVGVELEDGSAAVKAVVEPVEGARPEPVEIIRHCEGRLAYFMIPRFVELVSEMPRTQAGLRIPKVELSKNGVAQAWDRVAAGYILKR